MKRLLLLTFMLIFSGLRAQHVFVDSTRTQIFTGIRVRPSGAFKSVSAATEYMVQVTGLFRWIHPVFKGGYASYVELVRSPYQVDYTIRSTWLNPGLTFRLPGLQKHTSVYITPSLAFSNMRHELFVTIDNPYWGRASEYHSSFVRVISYEVDVGAFFSLYKRLSGVTGFTLYHKDINANPFPEIDGFDYPQFTPGVGYGGGLGLDAYLGLVFLLN